MGQEGEACQHRPPSGLTAHKDYREGGGCDSSQSYISQENVKRVEAARDRDPPSGLISHRELKRT